MARKSDAVKQADYRARHKDRFRARRILAAVEKLRALLSKHPPEAGSEWLLSIISVPAAIRESFDSVESEFGISTSDQVAAYIRAGYLAHRESIKIAATRGEHDVSAAVLAVGEKLSARQHDVQAVGAVAERISKPASEGRIN